MNERRKQEVYCDFKIIASGKLFPVHRLVLDASSEYFKAMLTHGMKESTQGYCEFNEDATAVEQCIEFIYTGNMDIRVNTVTDVLKLSHKWRLDGAVAQCAKFMQASVAHGNCVAWINLSSLYELGDLESTCITFLSQNLQKVNNIHELAFPTLQSLITTVRKRPEHAKVMWNIIKARIHRPDCDNPCLLIQAFHIERLTKDEYQSNVLKDIHIVTCRPCNEYVTKRRQAHAYKSGDIKIENCLAMKDQVIKYGAVEILQALDKYVVKHFSRICMRREFITLVTGDHLLNYICNIQRCCTQEEFGRIIEWFRSDRNRELWFRNIFCNGTGASSKFKHCLHTLTKTRKESLLSNPSHCCYLRRLAETYSCEEILEQTEYFIHWNCADISSCVDIAFLSVETMESYARTESLCTPNGGWTMWSAIRLWGRKEERNTINDFSRVFGSILFNKFSLPSLEAVSKDPLVKKSVECCAKILEVVLSRMSENIDQQNNQSDIVMSRISDYDDKFEEYDKQYDLADERYREHWMKLEKRTNEIEVTENLHWRNLNQANRDFRDSMGLKTEDMEISMNDLGRKIARLERENEELRLQNDDQSKKQSRNSRRLEQENVRLRLVTDDTVTSMNEMRYKLIKLEEQNRKCEQEIFLLKKQQVTDLTKLQEENHKLQRRTASILTSCVVMYCCYKILRVAST